MKKPKRKTLRNKLDKLCRLMVYERDNCQRCGGHNYLQTAHIFSRSMLSVRWDLDNMLLLCASCHFWAHKNPILFTEFVRNYLGEMKYENLKIKATMIKKFTVEELESMIKNYGESLDVQ